MMHSPGPFLVSSPLSASRTQRKKSRFTYRHLSQLGSSSTTCPLRVIAHVDLDAFYAQCEMVRLGISEDQPLAVQQWKGLIAVNYAARKFGITRHINVNEAKKLCPELICQHVATWKEGDESWKYHEAKDLDDATHKVSLDPYRRESRKILACMKEALPAGLQRVEKASVDEVFMDLCAQVHSILLERYPELQGPPPYDDPTENLPLPPTTVLDWQADALVDLDLGETEDDDPDWDDIAILIGSEIVRDVRKAVFEKLRYTVSGGVSRNKMLAKLGSAHKKPNAQTVIRNRAVQHFLSEFNYNKIRGLGGKLGDAIKTAFDTEAVKDLLQVPIGRLKRELGDDTGTWVYEIIRGDDSNEVNSRTQIKSMLSAKAFRPYINTPEQAIRWLRIFAADIYSRLVEDGVLENKRRPKTMTLHHVQGSHSKSKLCQIPTGKLIDETLLFDLGKKLLDQILLSGLAWPCVNLSMSVGGFEDGVSRNMEIGAFLTKKEEVKAKSPDLPEAGISEEDRPEKRRRFEASGGTQNSFPRTDNIEEHNAKFGTDDISGLHGNMAEGQNVMELDQAVRTLPCDEATRTPGQNKTSLASSPSQSLRQQSIVECICARCNEDQGSAEALLNHADWHFAKDLQDEDRPRPPVRASTPSTAKKSATNPNKKKNAKAKQPEKGQSKLTFG